MFTVSAKTLNSQFSMSNVLPCTDKNTADSNQHGSDSVVQLEAPVVNGDLVWFNQGRDGLGEGADEHVGHGLVLREKYSSMLLIYTISPE